MRHDGGHTHRATLRQAVDVGAQAQDLQRTLRQIRQRRRPHVWSRVARLAAVTCGEQKWKRNHQPNKRSLHR